MRETNDQSFDVIQTGDPFLGEMLGSPDGFLFPDADAPGAGSDYFGECHLTSSDLSRSNARDVVIGAMERLLEEPKNGEA